MNLILLDPREIDEKGDVTLADARAAHIRDVLHAKRGQSIRIGLIDGPKGRGMIRSLTPKAVTLRCVLEGRRPRRPSVDLLLALPRPKVMKRLWAQLAALGVGRIILSNAWKVERNYFDTHVLDPATYRPLLIEGLQQAGDTRLPEVTVHKRFKVLVEDELDALSSGGMRLVAQPEASRSMWEAVSMEGPRPRGPVGCAADAGAGVPPARKNTRLLLAVGPEGGWTEYEIDLLKAHGFIPVGMGPRILRADTACIALLALAHEALRGR